MGFLVLIGIIIALYLLSNYFDSKKPSHKGPRTYVPPVRNNVPPTSKNATPNNKTFRPTANSSQKSTITFKTSSERGAPISVAALEGLHDAFTGAPLDKTLGLYQCQNCKVYYHKESFEILREENNSKCVSCQTTNIIPLVSGVGAAGGQDFTPKTVTLANFKQHVGSVVTFEGYVYKVNESKRGNDFAVMFENKSWIKGFKLVFFRDAVTKVGGRPYINSLQGKTVKVRGLVVEHQKFGYEIIVSEKAMILGVR